MAFQKKDENEKFKYQVSTSLNSDLQEMWLHLCRKNAKSSHALLREVVDNYCRAEMRKTSYLPVVKTLGRK